LSFLAAAPLLLGLDLGSTSTKAALFDPERGLLANSTAPSPLYSDGPGWSEADTGTWWRSVCQLVPEVTRQAGVEPARIGGVACTGMVPAVVLLDRHGAVLRRAILQNDARAVTEIAELSEALEQVGYDVLSKTGSALTQQSVAPTWRWLTRHEPGVASATASLVGSYDWLAIALGAPRHVESNWALESGLYELSGQHAQPVLDAAALDADICAEVRRPGEWVGEVTPAVAVATSLPPGTPIYVGGADHVLAAYAAGLAAPRDWLVKLGGAGDILVVSATPAIDRRWYLDLHPVPGLWLPNGCMATSGSLLRWAQQLFGGVDLAVLDSEAAAAGPAQLICLPYFLGEKSPIHDPDLRGAFVGLHLGHTRRDLFRACMEAVAYGFRNHVEVFSDAGVELGPARVSNGGGRSAVWKQILADVLGTELLPVANHGGASLGAALVAAVGSGAFAGWGNASGFVRVGDPVCPTPAHQKSYEEGYATFLELQGLLTPVSHRLAARGRT
jgi:xylulokinase